MNWRIEGTEATEAEFAAAHDGRSEAKASALEGLLAAVAAFLQESFYSGGSPVSTYDLSVAATKSRLSLASGPAAATDIDVEAEVEGLRVAWQAMEARGSAVRWIYVSRAMHEAMDRSRDLDGRIGPPAEPSGFSSFFGIPFTVTQLLDDLGRHWWVSSEVGP